MTKVKTFPGFDKKPALAQTGSVFSESEIQLVCGYTPEQVGIIKKNVFQNGTLDELKFFLAQCQKTNLDPFSKQIYAWKMGGKINVQISIDGFRILAERTGKYRGQIGPFWCAKDGVWRDAWLENGPPVAAKIGVLKEGFMEPLFAVARFLSYAQSTPIWKKAPDVMIAKCAEALALRKAFPEKLSGLYEGSEFSQKTEGSQIAENSISSSDTEEKLKKIRAVFDSEKLGQNGRRLIIAQIIKDWSRPADWTPPVRVTVEGPEVMFLSLTEEEIDKVLNTLSVSSLQIKKKLISDLGKWFERTYLDPWEKTKKKVDAGAKKEEKVDAGAKE